MTILALIVIMSAKMNKNIIEEEKRVLNKFGTTSKIITIKDIETNIVINEKKYIILSHNICLLEEEKIDNQDGFIHYIKYNNRYDNNRIENYKKYSKNSEGYYFILYEKKFEEMPTKEQLLKEV